MKRGGGVKVFCFQNKVTEMQAIKSNCTQYLGSYVRKVPFFFLFYVEAITMHATHSDLLQSVSSVSFRLICLCLENGFEITDLVYGVS